MQKKRKLGRWGGMGVAGEGELVKNRWKKSLCGVRCPKGKRKAWGKEDV